MPTPHLLFFILFSLPLLLLHLSTHPFPIKKTAENVSLNGRIQQPTDTGYIRPADEYNNIVSNQRVVVNKNIPRLSYYTKDLDQFQQESLAKAINKGATMSTSAKGSLGATHRAQEVLNDMIDNSYDTSVIGTKKATTETRELIEVKDRLNQILEPSGIKPYDKSLSKAKNLQVSFDTNKPDQTLQASVFSIICLQKDQSLIPSLKNNTHK